MLLGAVIVAATLISACPTRAAQTCEDAIAQVAEESGVPHRILKAIGQVESSGWPWTLNLAGQDFYFRTKAEAVSALTGMLTERQYPDAGCVQMNMRYHAYRFGSVEKVLDPLTNVRAGAAFLIELKERHGTWERAAGAFHNTRDLARNQAYRCRLARALAPELKISYCVRS